MGCSSTIRSASQSLHPNGELGHVVIEATLLLATELVDAGQSEPARRATTSCAIASRRGRVSPLLIRPLRSAGSPSHASLAGGSLGMPPEVLSAVAVNVAPRASLRTRRRKRMPRVATIGLSTVISRLGTPSPERKAPTLDRANRPRRTSAAAVARMTLYAVWTRPAAQPPTHRVRPSPRIERTAVTAPRALPRRTYPRSPVATVDQKQLSEIAGWLRDACRVVALTGAGISTESGIPDFRGPNGIWTKDPAAEKTATLQYYMGDPEVRRRAWQNRLKSEMWTAQPNAAHHVLVELERKGALHFLVTQNVDGLHHAAGQSDDIVVEIHGNVREAKCMSCGWRGPMAETLDRVRAGEEDPGCVHCGGILKSATISFGENLVAEDLERGQLAASAATLFLALGTSLGVYPAAALPEIALRAGGAARDLQRRGNPVRRPGRRGTPGPARRRLARPCGAGLSRWEYPTLEVGFKPLWRATETC